MPLGDIGGENELENGAIVHADAPRLLLVLLL
jgi:hypothetical protein